MGSEPLDILLNGDAVESILDQLILSLEGTYRYLELLIAEDVAVR
jgi:hypothetical protein